MDFPTRKSEREKRWGKHGICRCGNCESAVQRALSHLGKMLDDGECYQYQFAISTGMGLMAQRLIEHEVVGQAPRALGPLGAIFAPSLTEEILSDIVQNVGEWMGENESLVNDIMNKHIERVNKRHEEEANLPKGD